MFLQFLLRFNVNKRKIAGHRPTVYVDKKLVRKRYFENTTEIDDDILRYKEEEFKTILKDTNIQSENIVNMINNRLKKNLVETGVKGQKELANLIVAWKDMLIPNDDICIKDSGVDEADITKFFKTFKYVYNHKLNCYFECQEIQLKFIDLNGNFNITEINTVAGVDEEIIKECARQTPYEKDMR
ncbi:hypothetical protein FQA39_LY16740 [Lamprigera yunnana]|nr:hypothetical protein FQA39_LY16740 [Lamprigera yunnana]